MNAATIPMIGDTTRHNYFFNTGRNNISTSSEAKPRLPGCPPSMAAGSGQPNIPCNGPDYRPDKCGKIKVTRISSYAIYFTIPFPMVAAIAVEKKPVLSGFPQLPYRLPLLVSIPW
jgi:hypothetical protein